MKIYILWVSVHTIDQEIFLGAYANKDDCLAELKHQQDLISADAIEFHMQETQLK